MQADARAFGQSFWGRVTPFANRSHGLVSARRGALVCLRREGSVKRAGRDTIIIITIIII